MAGKSLLKILNIAEKPSIAKKITELLSLNQFVRETSLSKYNPIFSFPYKLNNLQSGIQSTDMKFTSVTGHLNQINYLTTNKKWEEINPLDLFTASITNEIVKDKKPLLWNIENLSKKSDMLILWLDCDREGEAIAYEIIEISKKANPKIMIKRAIFSVVDKQEVIEAIENLKEPNKNLALAVDLRQELDLRIGSAFTVFQTVGLQKKHKELNYSLISYGPCQIPTLGFVVERYKEKKAFKSEKFWFLEGLYTSDISKSIVLHWKNDKKFTKPEVQSLLKQLSQTCKGTITKISEQERMKYKPYALNTIKLQKLASDFLNFSSDLTMKTAELLYNKGYISYPRTETNSFKKSTNFKKLVEIHKNHEILGTYANFLLDTHIYPPRDGDKSDNSHPPIYPSKPLLNDPENPFSNEEILLYELIARCFLACCSKDAVAMEKQIDISIESHEFYMKSLHIKELNFLTIYPYDNWHETAQILDNFTIGQILENLKLSIKEGKTYPPKLLNESSLIDLMDKNAIGTDSTIHEHIKKIQDRGYTLKLNNEFHPTALGYALIESYEKIGLDIGKPHIRANMEKDFKLVADGMEEKSKLLKKNIEEYENIYKKLEKDKNRFTEIFLKEFVENKETLMSKQNTEKNKKFIFITKKKN